jgi:hypothetical protein
VDVGRGEPDLESGDARPRPGGRADLGREVGERREVVPEERRRLRELVPGDLHAVAGVAGEADHDALELLLPVFDARLRRNAHLCSGLIFTRDAGAPDRTNAHRIAHRGRLHLLRGGPDAFGG